MPRLYDYLDLGNGYKIRLLLHHLDSPFELIECDVVNGETGTPEFLARNPNGRIPTLELEDDSCLHESSEILYYLASGTPWLPEDRLKRARVLQWMCFEQYNLEPNIATSRYLLKHLEIGAANPTRRQAARRLRHPRRYRGPSVGPPMVRR